MKQILKKCLAALLSRFPSQLPNGMPKLEAFTRSVCALCDTEENESYQHTISAMIMHLGPTTSHKAKRYFVKSILKAQANEVAYAKIEELRELKKQREASPKEEMPSEPAVQSV